jgi:hypothetical protein
MDNSICVYCSSSSAVDPIYVEAARALGQGLAERGRTLVYGGASVGLMGAVAEACHAAGGRVIGVIPRPMQDTRYVFEAADEIVVTADMRERKAVMAERSSGFVALPGGFGTLEEVLEVLTLKQLKLHTNPIAFINIEGFWEPLIALFEHLYARRFASAEYHRQLYASVPDVPAALDYLDDYVPPEFPIQWNG